MPTGKNHRTGAGTRRTGAARTRPLNERERALLTRQLAMLLRSGLPLAETLTLLEGNLSSFPLRMTVHRLRMDIAGGMTLSQAVARQPLSFGSVFQSVVRAGEYSGSLDGLMIRLADQQEKALRIKSRFKTALIQPAATLILAILVITVFLPGFTVLGVTLAIAAAVMTGRYLYRHSPQWRDKFILLALELPVFGTILQKIMLARWCRVMATLYYAGVLLSEALDTIADVTSASVYRNATLQLRDKVAAGGSLVDAMRQSGVFPATILQLARSGEDSGNLSAALDKSAEFFEEEAEQSIKRVFALMGPILLILIGCLVAWAMISFMSGRLDALG